MHGQTENDYTSGNEVCLECGLVLEQLYFNDLHPKTLPPTTVWKERYQVIYNLCDRLHIDPCGISDITDLSFSISDKWLLSLVKPPVKSWTETKIREFAAASIYVHRIKNDHIIDMESVAYLCEVKTTNIWKILKICNYSFNFKPLDFLPSYCSQLNFNSKQSFQIQKMAKKIYSNHIKRSDNLNKHSFSPKNVCLAILFSILNRPEVASFCDDFHKRMSMNKFAKLFRASPASIRTIYDDCFLQPTQHLSDQIEIIKDK